MHLSFSLIPGGQTVPAAAQASITLATLPVTPTARWHPQFSTVTSSGGRIMTATGVVGPDVTAGASGLGPLDDTDAMGRKFWRFTGTEYLDVSGGLTFSNRAVSVFAVTRGGGGGIFGLGNATGYGSGSTAVNTGGTILDTSTASGVAPFLRAFSRGAEGDAANGSRVILGGQVQVVGGVSRTTANGGIRLYINEVAANVSQSSISASGVSGAEIGRYPFNPGTSGNWTRMDLYELVVYDRGLTNAEADSVVATLTAHYSIAAITGQLVLEGDSISVGINLPTLETPLRVLTNPGALLVPAGYRVTGAAVSGNQVSNLVTRRDTANSWATALIPGGQNVMVFEIGRNDLSGITAAQHYANVVAYLNTPTTGVLQRGWTVRVLANIATGGSLQSKIEEYRALIRNPQFLVDTQTQDGGAFAGKLTIIDTDLIEDGGQSVFLTTADAGDGAYYQGDNTHLTALGTLKRANGGDTPSRGMAFGLS